MKHPAEVNILPMYLDFFINTLGDCECSFSSNLILLPPIIYILFTPRHSIACLSYCASSARGQGSTRGTHSTEFKSLAHDCECRLKIHLA